jgi:putative transposase
MDNQIPLSSIAGRDTALLSRDLRRSYNSSDIQIIKGVESKDHIHLHISYSPRLNTGETVKRLKGRSSRLLMQEYPELHRRYWGSHFGALVMVVGVWVISRKKYCPTA